MILKQHSRSGFTLVEVSLALVVVALGLLGLFHLFPTGLRAGLDATAETRCAQFADEVFNQVYADASQITTPTAFAGLFAGTVDIDLGSSALIELNDPDRTRAVQYPVGSGEFVRYRCDSALDPDGRRAELELEVAYGRAGGFTNVFYTEVYNFGM